MKDLSPLSSRKVSMKIFKICYGEESRFVISAVFFSSDVLLSTYLTSLHHSHVRKTLGILNLGPSPPPVLRLSDGGHVENLGILPLLRLRLKRIISVYGGCAASEQAFCNTLMNALEMARKKLRCSFTGMDGRDINEDIRINFVERSPGNQPRSYRFVT